MFCALFAPRRSPSERQATPRFLPARPAAAAGAPPDAARASPAFVPTPHGSPAAATGSPRRGDVWDGARAERSRCGVA